MKDQFTIRVLRGGSWNNRSHECRPTYRNVIATNGQSSNLGFRVVRQVKTPEVKKEKS